MDELKAILAHVMVANELDYEATVNGNGINASEAVVLARAVDKCLNLGVKDFVDSLTEYELEEVYYGRGL